MAGSGRGRKVAGDAAAKPDIAREKVATAVLADPSPRDEAAPSDAAALIADAAPAPAMTVEPAPADQSQDQSIEAPADVAPEAVPAASAAPAVPAPELSPEPEAILEAPQAPVTQKGYSFMATPFENMKPAAEKAFGDFNERAKGAMEKSAKFAEEATEFHKGNLEAVVASGRVAAKGVEEMAQYSAEAGRKAIEQATTAFKSFASVKSPTELFQLQSEYAKSSLDQMVSEASRFSETYLKLLGDIAQPLSSRYAVAAEKMKVAAI